MPWALGPGICPEGFGRKIIMQHKIKNIRSGQALVEFAIVMTVFLIMVLGVIDWGLYMFNLSIFETATRDAVRSAITWSDWSTNSAGRTAQIKSMIVNRTNVLPLAFRSGISGRVTVTFTPSLASLETITVAINNQPFKPISGFLGPMIPSKITVQTAMKYEP
jgi:Flp pilus assembly protein TadG